MIGSPVAVVTALLFYFGWVRTTVQARELGYDASIMDMSTTDYILKSITVLFGPLMFLLIIGLILHWLHERLLQALTKRPGRRTTARRIIRALRLSWIAWVPLAVVILATAAQSVRGFAIPLAITASALCTIYGRALERRIPGHETTTRGAPLLTLLLLAFAVFWDTERVARTMGEAYAADITANPQQLLSVEIYSTKNLGLSAPGITETRLTEPDVRYRYRYSGLRLLQRTGSRYFLINDRWNRGQDQLIVLRDTDDIRMEFAMS